MNFLNILAHKMMNRMSEKIGGGGEGAAPMQTGAGSPMQAGMAATQPANAMPTQVDFGGAMNPEWDAATASKEQDQRARNQGFRNYDQMLAWSRQRNAQSGGTIQGQGAPSGGGVPNPTVMGSQPMAIHPANMFNRILDAWKSATGQQGE